MDDIEKSVMAAVATLSSPGGGVSISDVRECDIVSKADAIDINIALNDLLGDGRLEHVTITTPFSKSRGVVITKEGWEWVKKNRRELVELELAKSEREADT